MHNFNELFIIEYEMIWYNGYWKWLEGITATEDMLNFEVLNHYP
jgi:hypothetical protein